MNYKILRFESLDSTNLKAKEIAKSCQEGTVIIANEQSGGRGRLGRKWASPKDKGLWMSIIIKPNIGLKHISKIALIAAAALGSALEEIGIESWIKWPNDIIIGNRKVAGILTEMKANMEGISYIVVGMGVNISQDIEDFPKEVQAKAGSLRMLTGKGISREILLEKILDNFKNYYLDFKDRGYISEVLKINRERSALIGRQVYIIESEDKKRKGRVIDISHDGELLVEFPEGIEKLLSGEVSVRAMEGYI